MIINTVMAVVNPDMPKTNLSQPLFVHVPIAGYTSKGIASYKETDFIVDENGQVSLNFDTVATAESVRLANASINNLGILYSNMSSDLNHPETGLKARVSILEKNIPLPTESDKGKILGVDEAGNYTFITLDDAEGVSV